jgi:hypothetical protein
MVSPLYVVACAVFSSTGHRGRGEHQNYAVAGATPPSGASVAAAPPPASFGSGASGVVGVGGVEGTGAGADTSTFCVTVTVQSESITMPIESPATNRGSSLAVTLSCPAMVTGSTLGA